MSVMLSSISISPLLPPKILHGRGILNFHSFFLSLEKAVRVSKVTYMLHVKDLHPFQLQKYIFQEDYVFMLQAS